MEETSATIPAVRLKNVFARGEAAVFTAETFGGTFVADYSGFNATGPILHCGVVDGENAPTSENSRFSLRFNRVVAVARSEFARFEDVPQGGDSPVREVVSSARADVSAIGSVIRVDSKPLEVVETSILEAATPVATWTLDGSLVLDVEVMRRFQLRRSKQRRDEGAPEDYGAETAKLSDFRATGDVPEHLLDVAPHLGVVEDFERFILAPARASGELRDAVRVGVDEIVAGFIDAVEGEGVAAGGTR
ncbi:MAG: hypothetical protein HUK22_06575 [Thermoguttaceae bacterium]|nr:hypothetical protein [Thermoguttaceae bacterium]